MSHIFQAGNSRKVHVQDLPEDGSGQEGVHGEHKPSPGDGDVQGDVKKSVLVKVVVMVNGEVLRVRGQAKH